MEIRHKNEKQENFPVGSFFLPKEKRAVIMHYYRYARHADDIADNPQLSVKQKIARLHELEDIFLGTKPYKGQKLRFVRELREDFSKHDLNTSLATDLLIAFRQDAMGFDYQTWGQLVEYCKYSAAPVGRFMLALFKEHPSTYLPGTSLCVALQIVNHLQDIKYDALTLRRVYIPAEFMQKYKFSKDDLVKDKSAAGLKKAIDEMLDLCLGLVKEGSLLPAIIKSLSLRIEVCVILSLTNIMIKKIKNGDVLQKHIKLSGRDWLKALCSGFVRGIFCKKKSLSAKVKHEQ